MRNISTGASFLWKSFLLLFAFKQIIKKLFTRRFSSHQSFLRCDDDEKCWLNLVKDPFVRSTRFHASKTWLSVYTSRLKLSQQEHWSQEKIRRAKQANRFHMSIVRFFSSLPHVWEKLTLSTSTDQLDGPSIWLRYFVLLLFAFFFMNVFPRVSLCSD